VKDAKICFGKGLHADIIAPKTGLMKMQTAPVIIRFVIIFGQTGPIISAKVCLKKARKSESAQNTSDYSIFLSHFKKCNFSHRLLALRRWRAEGYFESEPFLPTTQEMYRNACETFANATPAITSCEHRCRMLLKRMDIRLLQAIYLKTEILCPSSKKRLCKEPGKAIRVFLPRISRQLLLAAPLDKKVIGIGSGIQKPVVKLVCFWMRGNFASQRSQFYSSPNLSE